MDGILNLDKPPGLTSARVVGHVKRLLPRGTKIGHAGTLDPFATGVLLLLVGRATKRCEELMGQPKRYDATIKLGATTATDDMESAEIPFPGAAPVSRADVDRVLPSFVGTIQQRPPAYSAMKVGGRRSYELARQGKSIELAPRPVRVDSIEVIEFAWPFLKIRVDCGRGTYVRSLARDIGVALNVGGHLTELRRTRVGNFDIASAFTLESLASDNLASLLATQ